MIETAPPPALERAPRAENGFLAVYSRATAACAYVLLVAGALVTSTGSSLAVPDWPLSFGRVFPPMLGGVLFEHGHRMIAGAVSLLTFALALALRRLESRPWVRALGYAAAGLIVCQALLGGLTVLLRLPPAVSISHACLGQGVFCLLLSIAEVERPAYRAPALGQSAPDLWHLGAGAVGALYLQLALGALLRHTGHGLWAHAGWAAAAAGFVAALALRGIRSSDAELHGPARLLALALPAQLALGYASYRFRFSPDFETGLHWGSALTAAHLAVGALLLGTSVVWTLRAYRGR